MVGGTTLGYCATESRTSETAPITTIRMASTFARTGLSMKNFEIMSAASARAAGGLHLRVNLLTRDGPQQATDDHPILAGEAVVDDAHRADERPQFDF